MDKVIYVEVSTVHHIVAKTSPVCPVCKTKSNGATGGPDLPNHDDLSVCTECLSMLRYHVEHGTLSLQILTPEEFGTLPFENQVTLIAFRKTLTQIKNNRRP